MVSKLQWYNYDKPCFCSFKGEGKEHRRDRKYKIKRKRRSRRNKKILPVLGPVLIWPVEGGGPGPGGHCPYSDFFQFL